MRVRPEVSELSNEGTIRLNGFNVPALTVRRAETTVELGSGQSFMIAGLLRNHNTNSIDRAPFLATSPYSAPCSARPAISVPRPNRHRRHALSGPAGLEPVADRAADRRLSHPDEAQRLLVGQGNDSRSGEQRPGPVVARPAPSRRDHTGDAGPALPNARRRPGRRAPPRRRPRSSRRPSPASTSDDRPRRKGSNHVSPDQARRGLRPRSTAGCAAQPHQLSAANNTSLYSLHQPVVEHTNFVLDVAAGRDGVSVAEQTRLGAWFDSIGLRYGDSVSIDTPRGDEANSARHDVAQVAASTA